MASGRRSFWGWGFEERFPDRATRQGLGAVVSGLLGGGEFDAREPPRVSQIALRAPRIAPPSALAACCSAAPWERLAHTYGKSFRDLARGFAGDFATAPDYVARPGSERELTALLDHASERGVAVIPYGGGTSVVGGVEAEVSDRFAGAISLDLGGFAGVREVDPVSRAARIGAGTVGPALEAELGQHGLSLRHFPQSFEHSTLGGWIATRAGGHFATLYTHIDDVVEAVRMITPSGLWQSRRLPASGAGPSADRLVLGSEGTLGVITEAWVRVRPRPRFRASATCLFADFMTGVAATRALAQADLYPSNCRLLDPREAMLHQVTTTGKAVLLVAFESDDHELGPWLARALEIVRDHGGEIDRQATTAGDDGARDGAAGAWRAAFIDAPYLMNTMVSLGGVVDTCETACTWDRFEALHRAVITATRAALTSECGRGLVTCRFTHVYPDGPAPYYTFLGPAPAGRQLEAWREIKAAASEAIVASGGTITHHHAVGRVHRPWYERERPEPFARVLAAAKRAVDPAGILNPGVLLAEQAP